MNLLKRKWAIVVIVFFVLLMGAAELGHAWKPEFRVIVRVIDGDTLQLENGERIRLIGVDTPEKFESAKLERDARNTGQSSAYIQQRGEEASRFTRALCEGKRCWLEYDKDMKDRYGRTLAYIHLESGIVVNEEILRQGYGQAYTRFPFRYSQRYRDIQTAALRQAR